MGAIYWGFLAWKFLFGCLFAWPFGLLIGLLMSFVKQKTEPRRQKLKKKKKLNTTGILMLQCEIIFAGIYFNNYCYLV